MLRALILILALAAPAAAQDRGVLDELLTLQQANEALRAEIEKLADRVADLESRLDDAEDDISDLDDRGCSCDGGLDPYEERRELSPL